MTYNNRWYVLCALHIKQKYIWRVFCVYAFEWSVWMSYIGVRLSRSFRGIPVLVKESRIQDIIIESYTIFIYSKCFFLFKFKRIKIADYQLPTMDDLIRTVPPIPIKCICIKFTDEFDLFKWMKEFKYFISNVGARQTMKQ